MNVRIFWVQAMEAQRRVKPAMPQRAGQRAQRTTSCLLLGCLTSQQHASVLQGRNYQLSYSGPQRGIIPTLIHKALWLFHICSVAIISYPMNTMSKWADHRSNTWVHTLFLCRKLPVMHHTTHCFFPAAKSCNLDFPHFSTTINRCTRKIPCVLLACTFRHLNATSLSICHVLLEPFKKRSNHPRELDPLLHRSTCVAWHTVTGTNGATLTGRWARSYQLVPVWLLPAWPYQLIPVWLSTPSEVSGCYTDRQVSKTLPGVNCVAKYTIGGTTTATLTGEQVPIWC